MATLNMAVNTDKKVLIKAMRFMYCPKYTSAFLNQLLKKTHRPVEHTLTNDYTHL